MKVSREFLIGIVVVVSIALLYLGVSYLKGLNLLSSQETYYGVYSNIAGLTPSNSVVLNGYKIGIVKDVHLNPDGTIVVETVLSASSLRIPKDTQLEIFDSDLFGSKAIRLILGTSEVLAVDGDTLVASVSMGLTESIKQEIEPLKKKTQQLFAGVDSVINNLNNVLGGAQVDNLGDIFVSLKNTMKDLESTAGTLNGIMADNSGKLDAIFSNVESITGNLKGSNESLSNAIRNAEMITDSLAKLNLKGTLEKVDAALLDFNKLVKSINEGDGTLSKLISTDSLHVELVDASHSLDLLLNDMRIHPKRYLSFSLVNRNKGDEPFSKKELEEMRDEIDKALLEKEKKGEK